MKISKVFSLMLTMTLFAMPAIADDKAQEETQQDERAVIEQRAKSYAAAYNAKDLKALVAHWSPDTVYYGDEVTATADDYAQQAQTIVDGAPEMPADTQESDWMPLGVFAITQDGEPSGPAPTRYLQLQVNRDGLITGTLQNMSTGDVQQIEGAVDKQSQRSAWTVVDKKWPLMESGISNLTKDETAVLVHFEDGQTQQWLLVRMDDPDSASN